VKPATEEFLYFLLWTADGCLRPSWRHVVGPESFEAWAYRTGLSRRLAELERLKWIERRALADGSARLIRLTAAGREAALAGVDPAQRWTRSWDGRWRLVLFDVAEENSFQRQRLRRRLRELRFGYLQNSVWISPDPLEEIRAELAGTAANVESLMLFDGRPAGGESDQDLVAGAWDFAAIRECYDDWSHLADAVPLGRAAAADQHAIRQWAARERAAWGAIVARDPFLPEPLLPAGYPGRTAWARRVRLLTALGKSLSSSAGAIM
jgi:DNA-binding transcriptional regulator PaaX